MRQDKPNVLPNERGSGCNHRNPLHGPQRTTARNNHRIASGLHADLVLSSSQARLAAKITVDRVVVLRVRVLRKTPQPFSSALPCTHARLSEPALSPAAVIYRSWWPLTMPLKPHGQIPFSRASPVAKMAQAMVLSTHALTGCLSTHGPVYPTGRH